ncbi:unknown [Choristoneura fumiferana multiple nucleopolyhedrovirus]|uniref:RrmJ-type SAM-dependent 2'-O-MTase domain-containing protein n=1 Tax=Choristoneura fumiferana nuclear polyhedrosis virus TaxID=208973 RepID=Q7TLT2_NPVCF|nr:unknown [Choristoneura fumiferana multiple nucleopolyhedrovirus]AAP29847.1 unknown [Choristoneura fumiferana multiple nucleopolyhedrovirus]AGR56972.1 methyltransferase [Choristoneura occidentalis alphabaculovirus]
MSQRKLRHLKQKLGAFTDAQIKRARARLFDRATERRPRCWRKLAEIDKRFNVCRGVNTALDLCGGPGEFAAYTLWRSPLCRVFGVTLTRNAPYKRAVYAHSNFTAVLGPDGTGDVLDKNVLFDLSVTCGNACELVLADGAVDSTGREDEQERLNAPLILRETQLALICLRPGGNCVLKVFDAFYGETLRTLQQFARHFASWRLMKPPSSRPSNSERYLVCLGKLPLPRDGKADMARVFRKFCASQCRHLNELLRELGKTKHGFAKV